MARWSADSKDRVREAVDMVDLVSQRTELRRAGPGRYMARCCFHEERSASMSVDADQKLFNCFGCGVGGDAFSFVQLAENVTFPEALEWLAQRYGVELVAEAEDPEEAARRQRRERLTELLERVAAFYVRYLWESGEAAPAREYLARRGLEEGRLREFRVGFAPDSYDKLSAVARKQGFTDRELLEAGLVRARDSGGSYDFFRGRIMFPLCDVRGRVLGFGGRAMRDDQGPKYVNSPDSEVFTKGRWLFGADVARRPATAAGRVVLCEGYTDVIAMHQAGVNIAVGLMGTALTERQVAELGKLAPVVMLALDADSAGQNAMVKAARMMASRKLELRVVPLPAGEDPADFALARGAAQLAALVERSVPFVRFQVERELAAGDLGSAEGKDRVVEALKPAFAALAPSALREELVREVASAMDLQPSLVATWLPAPGVAAASTPRASAPTAPAVNRGGVLSVVERAERAFLVQCVALGEGGEAALGGVDPERFVAPVVRRAVAHLRGRLAAPGEGLPDDDPELVALVAELLLTARQNVGSAEAMEAERLKLELAHLERELTAGDGDRRVLLARREELREARDRAIERVLEQAAAED